MSADDTEPDNDAEPQAETEAPAEQPSAGDETIRTTRRNAATFFAGIAGAAAIGSFAVSALTGVNNASLHGGPNLTYKTIYTKGAKLVDKDGNPIKVDAMPEGSGKDMTVFPEKKGGGALEAKAATTVLVRFKESDYKKPTDTKGTVKGYAAYSRVCTHAGCIVSQRTGPGNKFLHCPCHQSTYNPLEGCKVVGGPAPRALPQLPIGLTKDGKMIIATGPFSGPIGPQ